MAEKDIGQEIIDKLKDINASLRQKKSFLKKNSHLHIVIETTILNEMKKRVEVEGTSLSEWCRKKLREDSQLDRIEGKLDKIIKL